MEPTIAYNASSAGITGITNLASQTGTIGTIFGSVIVIGMLMGVFVSMHSWNTKGWLYKLVKWLLKSVGENVLYGVATASLVGGVYYVGSELSKFGEANPYFLRDIAFFCGEAIVAIAALALVGWASKPVWNYCYDYATGTKKKVVKA
jgi:hypothetical protein